MAMKDKLKMLYGNELEIIEGDEVADFTYFDNSKLKMIYLNSDIKRIGHGAFFGCSALKVVFFKDKEYKKIISIFSEVVTKFIFTEIDNPRKCSVKELARALSKDLESESEHCAEFSDNVEALEVALNELENYDLLLIAGSLYLIGDLRPIIINKLTASD